MDLKKVSFFRHFAKAISMQDGPKWQMLGLKFIVPKTINPTSMSAQCVYMHKIGRKNI